MGSLLICSLEFDSLLPCQAQAEHGPVVCGRCLGLCTALCRQHAADGGADFDGRHAPLWPALYLPATEADADPSQCALLYF